MHIIKCLQKQIAHIFKTFQGGKNTPFKEKKGIIPFRLVEIPALRYGMTVRSRAKKGRQRKM